MGNFDAATSSRRHVTAKMFWQTRSKTNIDLMGKFMSNLPAYLILCVKLEITLCQKHDHSFNLCCDKHCEFRKYEGDSI